jgi:hypothetical protein
MTEPTPEQLQKMMDNFGYTEQEARISIHLARAEELLDELMRESISGDNGRSLLAHILWTETHVHEHFNALRRYLALRVLRRNYPKGWGYVPPADEEQG